MTNRTDLIYTRYPVLRSAMSETLDSLDDIAFAATVEQSFEGWSADELEINFSNLGRSLGRGLGQAGNVAARAAPGALTGAMQGASMGAALGPYGVLAGAALGAVGGGITSYSQSQQRPQQAAAAQPAPPQAPPPAQPAPRPQTYAPAPAAPAPQMPQQNVANAQAMTAQLLQLLSRPEVIQALLSLTAGAMGRRNIPVGNTTRAPEDILEVIGFTLQGSPSAAYGWTESHPTGPGAEIYEALVTSMPEDHPFGQTLAMLSDALDLNDPQDAGAYPAEAQHPYPALPPEYV